MATVLTRIQQTLVDVGLTLWSSKASFTGTSVPVLAIYTCPVVLAGIADTIIDVYLALYSLIPRPTRTLITLWQTLACGTIIAWGWSAVIDLHFTEFSAISRWTLTQEVWWLNNACGAILTNVWAANLWGNVALVTAESWSADALVSVYLPFNRSEWFRVYQTPLITNWSLKCWNIK